MGRTALAPDRTGDDPVVDLGHERARTPTIAGAKAAALARARASGLPVVPGAVLTVDGDPDDAVEAWRTLTSGGHDPIAVRSSSPIEDQTTTSMAGQFTTVLGVRDWPAVRRAIGAVRASAGDGAMAVLLQPMVDARIGGVLFGVDPVSGRADRFVVEAVAGTPDALVSGRVTASRHVLTRRGQLAESEGEPGLGPSDCRRLAGLARRAAAVFGGPQDIEWAIDVDDRLWLLQSRPVTAVAAAASGPRLGPGPVAETFPEPLAPLEADLWVEPLRAGIVEALVLAGAHSRRAIDASPVVAELDGWVAADLDLLEGAPRRGLLALLDPRPPARRLAASWRVGRLRRAIPGLAADLVDLVDGELGKVPRLADLDPARLLGVVGRSRLTLRAVHAHEVLAGAFVADDGRSAAAIALAAVAAGRAAGDDDDSIVARQPVALALVPPRVGLRHPLPAVLKAPAVDPDEIGPRESLRLRARWLQELTARAVTELGARLAAEGRLADALMVRWLTLAELEAMVLRHADPPADLLVRIDRETAAPLPAVFRLTPTGAVVADRAAGSGDGIGAGGGRGAGVITTPDDPTPGTVLVVRTLEPGLAAALPGRAGLVAETGSVLSHLAIVARELGVPTVVGVAGALERFTPGTRVVVDGTSGTVEVVG